MPGFHFKLDPALRQRERAEQERQRELAELIAQRTELEQRLRGMQEQSSALKRDLGEALVGRVDLQQTSRYAQHAASVQMLGLDVARAMGELTPKIEAARQRLLETTRQRRALELLRDRQAAEWRARQDRLEQAELDEAAMHRHVASSRSGIRGTPEPGSEAER